MHRQDFTVTQVGAEPQMKTIKDSNFLAQFVGDNAPFNTLENICAWAAS